MKESPDDHLEQEYEDRTAYTEEDYHNDTRMMDDTEDDSDDDVDDDDDDDDFDDEDDDEEEDEE